MNNRGASLSHLATEVGLCVFSLGIKYSSCHLKLHFLGDSGLVISRGNTKRSNDDATPNESYSRADLLLLVSIVGTGLRGLPESIILKVQQLCVD